MRVLQLPLIDANPKDQTPWIADEVLGCQFRDRRFGVVLKQLSTA